MVEDHCHYGLEFVVRDELSRQTTCLPCCFTSTYEDDESMSLHVRSFEHICRIMVFIYVFCLQFCCVWWISPHCRSCLLSSPTQDDDERILCYIFVLRYVSSFEDSHFFAVKLLSFFQI